MDRPKVLNTLAKISLIMFIAAIMFYLYITFSPYPALKLVTGKTEFQPRSMQQVYKAMIMGLFNYLPLPLMAVVNMKQKRLNESLALLTIIVAVLLKPMNLLLSLAGNYIAVRGGADDVGMLSGMRTLTSLVSGTLYGIGFILLICAAAIELYEVSRRKKEQGAESSGETTD